MVEDHPIEERRAAIGSAPRRFDRRDRGGEADDADRESPREDRRQDEVPAFELRGIPAADLGPEARAAFVRMMEDFERLRAEVRWGRDKIGGLEKRGDQHDYLPIANRRAFLRKLEEVARHRRHLAEGASLILVHVGIGDAARRELGLTAHDRLMEHAAGALVAMVHPTDTVAALGGHDFGILLILGSSRAAEVATRCDRGFEAFASLEGRGSSSETACSPPWIARKAPWKLS